MKKTFCTSVLLIVSLIVNMTLIFASAQENEASDSKISIELSKIVSAMSDTERTDISIWISYDEEFSGSYSTSQQRTEALKKYHTSNNEKYIATLPEGVKVTYVSEYSPLISAEALKPDILAIAQLKNTAEISGGSTYCALEPHYSFYSSTLEVDYEQDVSMSGKDISFLNNEYYKVFADYYLENMYNMYRFRFTAPPEKVINESLYDNIKLGNEVYLVAFFNYENVDEHEVALPLAAKNIHVSCFDSYHIQFFKTSDIEEIDRLMQNEHLEFITTFAPDNTLLSVNQSVFYEEFSPTPQDARYILRYAAGLESAPENRSEAKRFFFMSDTDLDGRLTLNDARTALRIAAGLEKGHSYYKSSSGCGAFWDF